MKKSFFILLIILIGSFAVVGSPVGNNAQGQGYVLLEPLPDPHGHGTIGGTDLTGYLQWLFAFAISIAGILAVLMIVIGGIQYMTAYGNPSQIENAKNRIYQALLGLLLAVSAWLILYTINPDLVKGVLNIPAV